MAFSLALSRIFEEGSESLPEEEQTLRHRMLTAITFLLMFTVFIQVRHSVCTAIIYMYMY